MNGWVWVLLVLLLIVGALVSSQVTIQIYYSRVKDNDRFYLMVRGVYGLFKHRYELPVIKFKGLDKGILVKKEHVNEVGDRLITEGSEQITKDKVVNYYRKARELLKATFHMKDWLLESMSRLTCTELSWVTRLGLGDAAETAITTGVVWTLKSSILTYLFHHVKRCANPKVQVYPDYEKTLFSTELSCIAKIRLGHAMIAGLYLIIRILKVKGGVKAWQNILFKAS